MTKKRSQPSSARQPAGTRSLWHGSAPVIVVPLDGSTEAKAALPLARLVARLTKATVTVVHASEEALLQDELLQRIKLERRETHGLIVEQLSGPPVSAILRAAEDKRAALIVITTRGRTMYHGHVMRPVVEQLVCQAKQPVLLVRPETFDQVAAMTAIHRMLLPLDGTPSSAEVIEPALMLAEICGADVDVLYVASSHAHPQEPGTFTVPRYMDQPHLEWPDWAQEFTSRFCALSQIYAPKVPTRVHLRRGDPDKEILRFAEEHGTQLIVLEWRGLLESLHAAVIKAVVAQAACPVLLLRTLTTRPC